MKVLVDEDLGSHELLARLREALPGEILAPVRDTSDEEVWARAQLAGAAILTGNVVDFLRLARERPDHGGLHLLRRANDPTRDLRAGDIAVRIARIAARFPDGIRSLTLVVNGFPLD